MNPKDGVGSKKAHLRHVPPALMIAVGEVMQTGATKYGPFNWREQPVSTMTYVEAMMRHLLAYMDGQDNAEDSGLSHLAHIAASCGILLDAEASGSRLEDRANGPAAAMLAARDHSAANRDAEPKVYPTQPSGWLIPEIAKKEIDQMYAEMTVERRPFVGYGGTGDRYTRSSRENAVHRALIAPPLVMVEEWGNGDGPTFYATEQPDGCYEYRGVHVHPSVASEQTFREIDRDIRNGYRPSREF